MPCDTRYTKIETKKKKIKWNKVRWYSVISIFIYAIGTCECVTRCIEYSIVEYTLCVVVTLIK